MARLDSKMSVEFGGHLYLTEMELRALDALAGYGTDEFVNAFFKVMGRAYLEPHVDGLCSLFERIRGDGRSQLASIDRARVALKGKP